MAYSIPNDRENFANGSCRRTLWQRRRGYVCLRWLFACSVAISGCSGYISCGSGAGPEAVGADSPAPQRQPAPSAPTANAQPTSAAPADIVQAQPVKPPSAADTDPSGQTRRQLNLLDREVPTLTGHVTDTAKLLDATDRKVLEHILSLYERRTGHQFVILTVPNLQGASVSDLGFTVASRAALGRKGKDDGVLITVAREERTVDIQVGNGLQQAISDELAARVIREQMAPAFRAKDYATGMRDGTKELMRAGETVP